MMALSRQIGLIVCAMVGLYAVALLVSLPISLANHEPGYIDSALAHGSLYMTESKYVFLNRASLQSDRPRVILLGASNTMVGLRPKEIDALVPNTEIDNLSLGGANITEVSQAADLALDQMTTQGREQATFVLGIWYGMFATNKMRWYTPDRHPGDTDLDIERYRYGFYRRTSAGPQAVLPQKDLGFEVRMIRPYLAVDRLAREANQWLSNHFSRPTRMHTEAERNAMSLSDPEKDSAMRYWQGQLQTSGSLFDEQFDVLESTVRHITLSGARVVIVDLPVPSWHVARSPYLASYALHRATLLARWQGEPNVSYLDMTDADADGDFSDEVHPKPRATRVWASRLAAELEETSHVVHNLTTSKQLAASS